jgi:hypothetical protein
MPYVFTLVFLASLVLLIIGLFNPSKAVFWKKSPSTRKQSAVIYAVAIMVSLVAIGMTVPNAPEIVPAKDQLIPNKTTIQRPFSTAVFPRLKKTDSVD